MKPKDIYNFYRAKIERLRKIGVGNKTRFGVEVTDVLLTALERRLKQLTPITRLKKLSKNGRII
jgi:hypothetical protein